MALCDYSVKRTKLVRLYEAHGATFAFDIQEGGGVQYSREPTRKSKAPKSI